MAWFRDGVFGISLAISLAWHLLWACVPNVELGPGDVGPQRFPVVAFLGPILEETAFERKASKQPDFIPVLSRKILISDEPGLRVGLPKDRVSPEAIGQPVQKELVRMEEVCGPGKEVPGYLPPESKAGSKPLPFEIGGPAKDRGLVSYPSTLTLPRWAKDRGLEFALKLRFWVSAEGAVRGVEPLVSSGYPEIDLLGIRYVCKLRFHPLSGATHEASQWGTISFKLQ